MLWMEKRGRSALWVRVHQGKPAKPPKKRTPLPVPESLGGGGLERLAQMLRDDAARRALHRCLREVAENAAKGQGGVCLSLLSAGADRSSEE